MAIQSASARRILCGFVVVLWAVVGFQWGVLVPRYGKIFREFGLLLPWYSESLLLVQAWLSRYWFVAGWMWLMALFLSVLGIRRIAMQDRSARSRQVAMLGLYLIPVIIFAWACLGVAVPYIKLTEALNR